MILNIIDRRKKPYRFRKVNAVIEPTRHDNRVNDSDHAPRSDAAEWIGYADKEHVGVHEAIAWAESHKDEVTLYLYDEDGGIYGQSLTGTRAYGAGGGAKMEGGK